MNLKTKKYFFSVKGTNRVIKKTTTINEIKNWYAGELIFETKSLVGGSAYTFWEHFGDTHQKESDFKLNAFWCVSPFCIHGLWIYMTHL